MELPFAALHQLCMPVLDRLDGLPEPRREALCKVLGLRGGDPPDRFLVGLAAWACSQGWGGPTGDLLRRRRPTVRLPPRPHRRPLRQIPTGARPADVETAAMTDPAKPTPVQIDGAGVKDVRRRGCGAQVARAVRRPATCPSPVWTPTVNPTGTADARRGAHPNGWAICPRTTKLTTVVRTLQRRLDVVREYPVTAAVNGSEPGFLRAQRERRLSGRSNAQVHQ